MAVGKPLLNNDKNEYIAPLQALLSDRKIIADAVLLNWRYVIRLNLIASALGISKRRQCGRKSAKSWSGKRYKLGYMAVPSATRQSFSSWNSTNNGPKRHSTAYCVPSFLITATENNKMCVNEANPPEDLHGK